MNPDNRTPSDKGRQPNLSGQPPLSERDFIQNGWSFASFPFWLWIFLIAAITALIWGSSGWYEGFIQKEKREDPFLQVTNRQFSVFLWQFPSFMRVHSSKKTGYLPGFLPTGENLNSETAEEFIEAPPDLVFLYHVWDRLLTPHLIIRPISPVEFENFLEQLPEWRPENWVKAPPEYMKLISSNDYIKIENLQILPLTALPLIVRQAFLGWKNYFLEGSQINDLQPTFGQIEQFLEEHVHYARNYWRNIQEVHHQQIAGLEYLSGFVTGTLQPDAIVPKEQLAPFLKVALYNAEQAKQNR